ncbi:MAG: beta-lactamase family protein, partial [Lachnospiraceae bacterium]|nr:beta-lactamase family protein [Lachnospiraceae bacterium]
MNVLRLAEQNIVNLDESISAYWGFPIANPNYPDKLITLRSILTHTSSIADLEVKNVEYKLRNNVVFRNVEPSSASAWSYCNFAFGVAGATLEKAAGKSIFEISKENFFEPMNIDVAFAPGRLQNKEQLASLYYAGGSLARSKEEMYYYMGSDIPSNNAAYMMGGVCTSAQDLAKLISILINDGVYQGERYLSEESVVAMETRYCDGSQHGVKFEQCMPLDYTSNIYGEDGLYFHTGSAYGVYALISYNPNNKNGVVVITTGASGVCDGHGIYAVCGEIAEFLYNEGRKNIIKHGGL